MESSARELPTSEDVLPIPEDWVRQREYDRIANEIRQSQDYRIRILLGALTAVGVILGVLAKVDSSVATAATSIGGAVLYGTLHLALFSCILMSNNYTRSINSQSMYLEVYFKEQWMWRFRRMSSMMDSEARENKWLYILVPRIYSTGEALKWVYCGLTCGACLAALGSLRDAPLLIVAVSGTIVNLLVLFTTEPRGRAYYGSLWESIP